MRTGSDQCYTLSDAEGDGYYEEWDEYGEGDYYEEWWDEDLGLHSLRGLSMQANPDYRHGIRVCSRTSTSGYLNVLR